MARTYPTLWVPDDTAAENLGGTTPDEVKIPYLALGAIATLVADRNRIERSTKEGLDTVGRGVRTSGGNKHVGVFPFWYRKSDETAVEFEGASDFELTTNATNYVYVLHATNALTKDTTSFPADAKTFTAIGIWAVNASGVITTSDKDADARGLNLLFTPANSTAPTGTTGTSFTLDSDNAGAEVDQDYRANRGSTDAEDAALRWDASDDRWQALEQHTTGTRCPVDASEFQVDGTAALDSDGAAKVAAAVAGGGLAHAAGVLSVNVDDSTIEIDTNVVQVKDGGITAAMLADAVADKLVQVSIPDANGANPQTVQLQMLDRQGNNLAEVCYVRVAVYDDADGTTAAVNATIATGAAGSTVRSEVATKDLVCKTDATGALDIAVTDGVSETVYLLAQPTTRSRTLDCADIGTVVIT